ncbi:MAG: APC family permease [Thermoleophilia bacterium]
MPVQDSRLERTLTLWPIVLFGIAYITPFIVLTTFGVFSEAANGNLPTSYLLGAIAMIFTALSYGKMAHEFPVAGSAYTYTRKAVEPRVGFLVGWALLLDYLFLPMVVWLIGATYLSAEFPSVPTWVFLIVFIVLTTGLNVLGIKLTTRVNLGLVAFQMAILVAFLLLALKYLAGVDTGIDFAAPFFNSETSFPAISAGAALTAYAFIGFDAVSTFAEEAVDPRRTIPRAIVLTAGLAAVVFVIVAYVMQLVHPRGVFADSVTAPMDMAKQIGGDVFGSIILGTVILAQFTAGVPIQAAGARLVFAMGRDNVLPKRLFAYVLPKQRTPAFNLVIMGAIGLLALFSTVANATSFINFGAFTGFAFVNISVIALYLRGRGSAKRGAVAWVVAPLIGLAVSLYLMSNLDWKALTLGGIWVVIGIAYLAYLTKGFQVEPPEMDFSDQEDLLGPDAAQPLAATT